MPGEALLNALGILRNGLVELHSFCSGSFNGDVAGMDGRKGKIHVVVDDVRLLESGCRTWGSTTPTPDPCLGWGWGWG